jgi:hypothetical protein
MLRRGKHLTLDDIGKRGPVLRRHEFVLDVVNANSASRSANVRAGPTLSTRHPSITKALSAMRVW